MDYIKQIAEKLAQGEEVVFYTVGSGTFLCIRELKKRFNMYPTAICDRDLRKQGHTWKGLADLTVLSPDETIQQCLNAYWYIPSLDNRFQIIGYLTQERGIAPERILNYTPVRKMRSCITIHKEFYYNNTDELSFCCWQTGPCVSAGKEKLNIDGLRALQEELIKAMEMNCVPADSPCAGCSQIREDYYPTERGAWNVNYFGNNICNYRCIYCGLDHAAMCENRKSKYSMSEVLDALKQENVLQENYLLSLVTAGEPMLYPNRAEVYKQFDGEFFTVDTNGYVYDPDLFALMNEKKVTIVDSIDAGTRETYKRIKGVDGFERVRQNLKRYAQASVGIVVTKFIFIPGVNDFPEEVDGFIDFCVDVGASYAMAAIEYSSLPKTTERTHAMIRKLTAGLSQYGVLCVPFSAGISIEYTDSVRSLME